MTYEQIWSVRESGKGVVFFRFLVSDTYSGLFGGESYDDRVTVDFIAIETTKQDLDLEDGKQASHELSFWIDKYACLTNEDKDCFDFILDAQQDSDVDLDGDGVVDIEKQDRWVLFQISEDGGSTWLDDFRGKVQAKMSADDLLWNGSEFSSSPNPDRVWKCTALQFETAVLDLSIVDILAIWDSGELPSGDPIVGVAPLWAWRNNNAKPRRAFPTVLSPAGTIADHEWAFFWGLTSFDDFVIALLNVTAQYIKDVNDVGSSFDITVEPVTLPFECSPCLIQPVVYRFGSVDTVYPFYKSLSESSLRNQPALFNGDDSHAFKFSWSMVQPRETKDKSLTFLKSKSVIGLIGDLARAFGLFLFLEYIDDDIVIKFKTRAGVAATGDVFIADASTGSLDTEPIFLEADNLTFTGRKNRHALDGRDEYTATGGLMQRPATTTESNLSKASDGNDNNLILTTGYTSIEYDGVKSWLYNRSRGFYEYTFESWEKAKGLLNLFIDKTIYIGGVHCFADGYNLDGYQSKMDTGLYLDFTIPKQYKPNTPTRFNGFLTTDIDSSSNSYDAVLPIDKIYGLVGKDYNGQVFYSLSEYVNSIRQLDGKFYESEYQISVPYLTRFRNEIGGAESVACLSLGRKLVLDGIEWVVVGIERSVADLVTTIRLHNKERFAVSTYDEGDGLFPLPPISGELVSESDVTDNVIDDCKSAEIVESQTYLWSKVRRLVKATFDKLMCYIEEVKPYEVVCHAAEIPTAFSVPNASYTIIPFLTVIYEPTSGSYSPLTGFTVEKSGYYDVDVRFVNESLTTPVVVVYLSVYAGASGITVGAKTLGTEILRIQGSTKIYCDAGDSIKACLYQASGAGILFNTLAHPGADGYISISFAGKVTAATNI